MRSVPMPAANGGGAFCTMIGNRVLSPSAR